MSNPTVIAPSPQAAALDLLAALEGVREDLHTHGEIMSRTLEMVSNAIKKARGE